ncbi:uncharacterized protein Z520_11910 [Fonsecaea multimorphosa CBS 102226]|uniref:Major facilitator superfamily (MFS) profile domain-containing protein n=1 Tax=Fonsecaea multimorphosa CBS 102226 TaxID=1442371 RepID=A0A0D2GSK5_9EURO|nr:uncharacterized protein Z520_11910 [Fonsecaea multimorphosa CBS 102226]KIX92435.1 hypothetical protein Z520_11910 [Fonsecaea multimorphosa CBS 102226]OAL17804.1 hypothetical protein AYO22_11332 [Fonsecaea multimorphosa]
MDNLDIDLESAETAASHYLSRPVTADSAVTSRTASTNDEITRHVRQTERLHSQRLQHVHTVGSTPGSRSVSRAESEPLPPFGGGKPYPPAIPAEREAYVVDFAGVDDPSHPLNWQWRRKLAVAAVGALACLCSTFGSAVLSPATARIGEYFHLSVEVSSLSSALYLAGYGFGPTLWAPMSELRGRKLPLLIGNFGFSIFALATAVSKDVQTLMICRFFMGVFGSSPIVIVAAVYSDIYRAEQRGLALTMFAVAVFLGPMVAPIVGSFTVTSYLGWRWNGYWSMIMGFATFLLIVLVVEETYPPAVLVSKAELLRRRTKNWAIHAKQEEIEISIQELIEKNLTRPLRMLVTEPLLLLTGFYLSFVYGLMYVTLSAYPLIFRGVHGMTPGVGSLPFLGIALGMVMAGIASISMNSRWARKYRSNNNRALPEWRLPLAMVGGFVFTIGLFWLGWTGAYSNIHWIVPTIAGVFVGFGLLSIFMQLVMYIIDAYLMFAASALAGNTIIRSLFAAACPLFDRQMFENMKIQWGFTLLGCVAAVLVPVPLLLHLYGPKLRQKSKWAPTFSLPPQVHHEREKETELDQTSLQGAAQKGVKDKEIDI